mmetsp:Transcript_22391/g.33342  ORF Transcript_22391/g.33342 Transcript_22391/m.33342 type:complete len:256 (+) Transcript_22391:1958-2725(+)
MCRFDIIFFIETARMILDLLSFFFFIVSLFTSFSTSFSSSLSKTRNDLSKTERNSNAYGSFTGSSLGPKRLDGAELVEDAEEVELSSSSLSSLISSRFPKWTFFFFFFLSLFLNVLKFASCIPRIIISKYAFAESALSPDKSKNTSSFSVCGPRFQVPPLPTFVCLFQVAEEESKPERIFSVIGYSVFCTTSATSPSSGSRAFMDSSSGFALPMLDVQIKTLRGGMPITSSSFSSSLTLLLPLLTAGDNIARCYQ